MSRTIFKNVNLLDGEHAAGKGTTVVIENDRIVATTTNVFPSQPADSSIDLGGLTMMPGMVGGHFHAPYHNGGGPDSSKDCVSAAAISYIALSNAQTALRCGFTSVVSASTFFDIDPALASAIDTGMVEGPRFVPCSRFLIASEEDMESPYRDYCAGPKSFAVATERAIADGARIIKLIASQGHGEVSGVQRNMTADELRAVVEVGRAHGVRTRAHVAGREMNLLCARSGVDILDHADGMDDECIDTFLEHGCFVLPSLYLPYVCKTGAAAGRYAERFDTKDYDYMMKALPKAVAAGLKIAIGDDFGTYDLPHGTYANEMVCYVEEGGIEPLEVIKWATRNGGELTGIADVGTIAAGKLADLVIVDGDPSADIRILTAPSRIVAVLKGGKVSAGRLPTASGVRTAMVA